MATRHEPDPRRLDVAAFAGAGGTVRATERVAAFPRLAESTLDSADRPVEWRLEGRVAPLEGAGRVPCLQVAASGAVALQCQRCLEPVEVELQVDRRLCFVVGEDAAAALDAEQEDDVLALEPSIDARSLVEDELLLALPLVPRHDVCPVPLAAAASPAEPAEHPFAALAALRTPGRR